jgi:hypothetical protein
MDGGQVLLLAQAHMLEVAQLLAGRLDGGCMDLRWPFTLCNHAHIHSRSFTAPSPGGATHCYEFLLDMPTKPQDRAHPALEQMFAEMEKEVGAAWIQTAVGS